ncbi:prolyl oligopeptidase family serine peptidase [Paenibacillus sp. sptzw28]|uniref:carboxylesterase family protein n=1 Tax=Paenibacillus sp. sptzw28 TaxID=715179 RepID=UPI001C6E3BA3|nr:PHB depolymerase family esterase [Paenibacillus sp. sptzw28]QYR20245.1 prolyl oligopeptidase family serine peptidase [Paenibacillus sp. sptzw28]
MSVTNHMFKKDTPIHVSLNYQLFLPHDIESKNDKKYPLILFLHGIKKRGEDISLLNNYGLTWIAESKPDFPFIVVTPQCPTDSNWVQEYQQVLALIDEIITNHPIDSERIYLTGFSMGGNGTWDFASRSPELFSAIVPISGWFEPDKAMLLKDVPIWAFHCVDDDVVHVSGTEDMDKALTSIEGNVKVTYYSGFKHDHKVMHETYNNTELYNWLLNQKKR